MMRKIGTFILTILLLAIVQGVGASGEGAATLYNQGNAYYAKGDYKDALQSYKHALDQKVADPRLEQNIGSAYLKTGDIGQAVYHFQRGLLLTPRDGDLRHNLKHAQSLRKDEVPANGLFVSRLFTGIAGYFTTGEWIAIFAALFVTLNIALLLMIIIQGRARPVFIWLTIGFTVLVLLAAPFALSSVYSTQIEHNAIVVASKSQARSGPANDLSEAFVVHAGMPCTIEEQRANWALIQIPTGLSGWIPLKDIRVIRF